MKPPLPSWPKNASWIHLKSRILLALPKNNSWTKVEQEPKPTFRRIRICQRLTGYPGYQLGNVGKQSSRFEREPNKCVRRIRINFDRPRPAIPHFKAEIRQSFLLDQLLEFRLETQQFRNEIHGRLLAREPTGPFCLANRKPDPDMNLVINQN